MEFCAEIRKPHCIFVRQYYIVINGHRLTFDSVTNKTLTTIQVKRSCNVNLCLYCHQSVRGTSHKFPNFYMLLFKNGQQVYIPDFLLSDQDPNSSEETVPIAMCEWLHRQGCLLIVIIIQHIVFLWKEKSFDNNTVWFRLWQKFKSFQINN